MATSASATARRDGERFPQPQASFTKRPGGAYIGPSAWARYEPSTSAVMLPEGWSLSSSTEQYDGGSTDAGTRFDQNGIRRQNSDAHSQASDNGGMHWSNTSMGSLSTTHAAQNQTPSGQGNGPSSRVKRSGTFSGVYPPSTSSSRGPRTKRRGSQPEFSAAESIFTQRSQSIVSSSEASTGITNPSPGGSIAEIDPRTRRKVDGHVRRVNSAGLMSSDNPWNNEGGFDITIPVERAASEIENTTYQRGGWTHETISQTEQDDDDGSSWAVESIAVPFGDGYRGFSALPRTSSLDEHTTHMPWRDNSVQNGAFTNLDVPQSSMSTSHMNNTHSPHVIMGPRIHSKQSTTSTPLTRSPGQGRRDLITGIRKRLYTVRPSFNGVRQNRSNDASQSRISSETARAPGTDKDRISRNISFENLLSRSHLGTSNKQKRAQSAHQDQNLGRRISLDKISNTLKQRDNAGQASEKKEKSSTLSSIDEQVNKKTEEVANKSLLDRLKRRPTRRRVDEAPKSAENTDSKETESQENEPAPVRPVASALLLSSLSPMRRVRQSMSNLGHGISQENFHSETDDVHRPASPLQPSWPSFTDGEERSERPLRTEPAGPEEEGESAYVTRQDVLNSIENRFNAAHKRRWSLSATPTNGRKSQEDGQTKHEQRTTLPDSNLSAVTEEQERPLRRKSLNFGSRLMQPLRPFFTKRHAGESEVEEADKSTSQRSPSARLFTSRTELPRRYSLSYLMRPSASAVMEPSSSSAAGHVRDADKDDVHRGTVHFLTGRPSTPGSNGLRRFGSNPRSKSIDLSKISRPTLIPNLDKPLPPPPSSSDEAKSGGKTQGHSPSVAYLENGEIRRRISLGDMPARTSMLMAQSSLSPPLEEIEEVVVPAGRTNQSTQTVPDKLADALRRRQTQSFSDLYAYSQQSSEYLPPSSWNRHAVSERLQGTESSESTSANVSKPNFGLDLQPDAAAAFDSIPLPDTPSTRQSFLRSDDTYRRSSRTSLRGDSLRGSVHDSTFQPEFDGPGDVSDSAPDEFEISTDTNPQTDIPQNVEEDEFSDALERSSGEYVTVDDAPVNDNATDNAGKIEMLADSPKSGGDGSLEHLKGTGSVTSLVASSEFGSAQTHVFESPRVDSNIALKD